MFVIYDVIFEIYIEEKLQSTRRMQAPKEIIIINFMDLMQQTGNDQKPIKIKLINNYPIWDNFEQKQKLINNLIEFSNNATVRKGK